MDVFSLKGSKVDKNKSIKDSYKKKDNVTLDVGYIHKL